MRLLIVTLLACVYGAAGLWAAVVIYTVCVLLLTQGGR